jgi:asparagine synthase (glutamine-hydrolysing)
MCGITGIWDPGQKNDRDGLRAAATAMADTLVHRGPDDSGVWVDADAGVALAHRRLSIIDLSPEGHQPMMSASGRYVIIFNGEIYNYRALRPELEKRGHRFRGHSDTEIMLAAISEYGVERALSMFNGMFAFALWDSKDRVLYLARDRLGEKPLYYGNAGKALVFASELKALRACAGFASEIDRDVLALYVRHNYVPGPYSIYRGVRKLTPGTYLKLGANGLDAVAITAVPIEYWSARIAADRGVSRPFAGSEEDALREADRLLKDAVRSRMEADVPLGAFLSGGIDSSTVVALMQSQSTQPVRTFTIGFAEPGYDEAAKARGVANHLRTSHTELRVTPREAQMVIPSLSRMYDEPFADSSQIPTFLVSRLARQHVTVSLSGDGGDELFGGYNRYFWGRTLWNRMGGVPAGVREAGAAAIRSIPPHAWDRAFDWASPFLLKRMRQPNPGHKLHKIAGMMSARTPEDMYLRLVSYWQPDDVVLRGVPLPTALTDGVQGEPSEFFQRMMLLDTLTYLPDDILVKLDRASMAVGLESRVPLLDHRVVEFAWTLPAALKVRGTEGKRLLRKVLHGYIPQRLVDQPKMGFGIPIGAWIRNELRDWAEDLLDERKMRQEGLLKPEPIIEKWRQHRTGLRNWQDDLWGVMMFLGWVRDSGGRATSPS